MLAVSKLKKMDNFDQISLFTLGHIKLILSFSSSPAPDFSARVGQHEYQMGGVWGRVLASRDQIDTSLRSLYIAGTINR